MNERLAPVALFVYNRVNNTLRTLQALANNTLARDTKVYVFSDGGRDKDSWAQVSEVRNIVRQFIPAGKGPFLSLSLIERPENYYLERNIIEGISQVLTMHDRIIVLEDDIVTSPYFLQYMNEGFDHYADVQKVMHIAGFTHLCHPEGVNSRDFYFTPHMSGWGWGTWRNRWQQHFRHYQSRTEALAGLADEDLNAIQYNGAFPCLKSLDKNPIPWDICWELAIYKAHGLCLSPAQTLVRNVGLTNGTHFQAWNVLQYYEYDREPTQKPICLFTIENPAANPIIERQFAEAIVDWGIRYTTLGKIVRWLYRSMKKLGGYFTTSKRD